MAIGGGAPGGSSRWGEGSATGGAPIGGDGRPQLVEAVVEPTGPAPAQPGVALELDRCVELVRELGHDGATILMATHEMAFAREVAHRVVFLDGGRIVEQGPPAQLFGAPREERTRAFLARLTTG